MRISGPLVLLALGLAGCGSIAYDDGTPDQTVTVTTTTTSSGGYLVTRQPVPQPQGGPYVVVVPNGQAAQPVPPAPQVIRPPRAVATVAPAGRVQCGNNDHIRLDGQVIDGGNGPGVVASGGCNLVISESIIRGEPAVLALDGARVVVRESRVQGGIRAAPSALVQTPGSRMENLRR